CSRFLMRESAHHRQRENCPRYRHRSNSMTALSLRAMPLGERVAPKLRALGRRILRVLDAFGEARACNAVPEWRLRKVQRAMKRYRELMLAESPAPRGRVKGNANVC